MFSLFGKIGKNDILEERIRRLQSNCENNYKDAAQENLRELETEFAKLKESGRLSDKQIARYEQTIETYREQMKKFTHKDQTPYWT